MLWFLLALVVYVFLSVAVGLIIELHIRKPNSNKLIDLAANIALPGAIIFICTVTCFVYMQGKLTGK